MVDVFDKKIIIIKKTKAYIPQPIFIRGQKRGNKITLSHATIAILRPQQEYGRNII